MITSFLDIDDCKCPSSVVFLSILALYGSIQSVNFRVSNLVYYLINIQLTTVQYCAKHFNIDFVMKKNTESKLALFQHSTSLTHSTFSQHFHGRKWPLSIVLLCILVSYGSIQSIGFRQSNLLCRVAECENPWRQDSINTGTIQVIVSNKDNRKSAWQSGKVWQTNLEQLGLLYKHYCHCLVGLVVVFLHNLLIIVKFEEILWVIFIFLCLLI